ncbi:MAG: hypothetical protein FWD49_04890 [Firmicutes bacterium]|nr:hypothetical protein [Bacillota bacterium]
MALKKRPMYHRKKHPRNYTEYSKYYQDNLSTAKRSEFAEYNFNDNVDSKRPLHTEVPVPLSEWIIIIILSLLPIINLFCFTYWATNPAEKLRSKKNFAKASLAVSLAVIAVITIYVLVAVFAFGVDIWGNIKSFFEK